MSLGADIGGSLVLSPVGRDSVGECNHEIDRTQKGRLSPRTKVPQPWHPFSNAECLAQDCIRDKGVPIPAPMPGDDPGLRIAGYWTVETRAQALLIRLPQISTALRCCVHASAPAPRSEGHHQDSSMRIRAATALLLLATWASPVLWAQDDPDDAGDESQWEDESSSQEGESAADEGAVTEDEGNPEFATEESESGDQGAAIEDPGDTEFAADEDVDASEWNDDPGETADGSDPVGPDDSGDPAPDPDPVEADGNGNPPAEPAPPVPAESPAPRPINPPAAANDLASQCPSLSATHSAEIRWEAISTPDMLFCRAVLQAGGEEAFALTISRDSPFKPRRSNRAEVGQLGGAALQWYSGENATSLQDIVREALVATANERKVHIFMRATDADAIARRQRMVESLEIERNPEDE